MSQSAPGVKYKVGSLEPAMGSLGTSSKMDLGETPLRAPLVGYPLNKLNNICMDGRGGSFNDYRRVSAIPMTTKITSQVVSRVASLPASPTIRANQSPHRHHRANETRVPSIGAKIHQFSNDQRKPERSSHTVERTDDQSERTELSVLSPSRRRECKEIPITQWIIRRIRRMLVLNKKKDTELEETDLTPIRYRPIAIEQLSRITKFTKQELQHMYRGFKQECPTGVISEDMFKSIYCNFFPLHGQPQDGTGRNTAMYAHYVFGTMDQDGTGSITFGQFIMGLSILVKGSLQERLHWAFNLYDINNDGYITKEELIDIASSIYDLMGDQTNPRIDDIAAVDHVDKIFDKLDLNKDGVVTIDEFMEYCSKNEEIVSSLDIFNCL